jgi:hypothetical protein
MLVGTREHRYRIRTSSNRARERLMVKKHDHRKVRKRTVTVVALLKDQNGEPERGE